MAKTSIHGGNKYITATYRGTEYTLMRNGDGWGVATRRIALGRFNTGGFKHYRSLAEVAAGCKAFSAVELVNAL